jgi:hypothetical protein
MIRVFLRGGLGNQLFQYAAGIFLARKQGTRVLFRTDLLPVEADSIGLVSRWPNQLSEFKGEGLMKHRKHQPKGSTHLISKLLQVIRVLGDLTPNFFLAFGVLTGERNTAPYFTNPRKLRIIDSYCSSVVPAVELGEELRSQIRDITVPSASFLELANEAMNQKPIVVHVRLGDYQNFQHLYGEPQYESIAKVVKFHTQAHKVPVWLFTDSPDRVPEQILAKLGADKVIGPGDLERPIENLVLMSMGSALICSNSTFSWWAAFLMGTRGNVFFPKTAGLPQEIFSRDMVIEGWTPY